MHRGRRCDSGEGIETTRRIRRVVRWSVGSGTAARSGSVSLGGSSASASASAVGLVGLGASASRPRSASARRPRPARRSATSSGCRGDGLGGLGLGGCLGSRGSSLAVSAIGLGARRRCLGASASALAASGSALLGSADGLGGSAVASRRLELRLRRPRRRASSATGSATASAARLRLRRSPARRPPRRLGGGCLDLGRRSRRPHRRLGRGGLVASSDVGRRGPPRTRRAGRGPARTRRPACCRSRPRAPGRRRPSSSRAPGADDARRARTGRPRRAPGSGAGSSRRLLGLLEAEAQAMALGVERDDLELELLALVDDVARVGDALVGQLADVDQALEPVADADEGAEVDELRDRAVDDVADLEVGHRRVPRVGLEAADREADPAALVVDVDDLGLDLVADLVAGLGVVDLVPRRARSCGRGRRSRRGR